jgi:guanylate kinase
MGKKKIVILSGPSCVGKTPLIKTFEKLYPELAINLKKIVLYNSRFPRPSEKDGVDYYFRERNEIEILRNNENYIVIEVRGDLQALDINVLLLQLENNDVFYEGNTYIAKILMQYPLLVNVNKLSIFLSPFRKDEILKIHSDKDVTRLQDVIIETMKNKLVLRSKKFNQELTENVLENINVRASDAFSELKEAWKFDFVIPNHDGEDSDNWNEPIPTDSDAYLVVKEFSNLIKNENWQISEKWTKTLFD